MCRGVCCDYGREANAGVGDMRRQRQAMAAEAMACGAAARAFRRRGRKGWEVRRREYEREDRSNGAATLLAAVYGSVKGTSGTGRAGIQAEPSQLGSTR